MSDEGTGRGDGETRPLRFDPPPVLADPEPAVAAALAVIERALGDMATSPTLPLLDPPTERFRLRPLARTGLSLFPVALDTAALAGAPDRQTAHRVLDAYAALGGNTLVVDDVADGSAAQAAGTWLRHRRRRDSTVLVARIGTAGLAAPAVTGAAERMLHRLGVERLDLLVLDGGGASAPLEETLTALAGLVETGRVDHLAAGDLGPERLIRARVLAGQRGLPRFAAVAPEYSLLQRDRYEDGTAAVVHAQDLACLPVAPLAGGLLAGGVPSRQALRRLRDAQPQDPGRPGIHPRRGARIVETVLRIAEEREVPPAAIALAWLLTRPHVVAPVVAAGSVEHVWAAGAAAAVHLSRADAVALARAAD